MVAVPPNQLHAALILGPPTVYSLVKSPLVISNHYNLSWLLGLPRANYINSGSPEYKLHQLYVPRLYAHPKPLRNMNRLNMIDFWLLTLYSCTVNISNNFAVTFFLHMFGAYYSCDLKCITCVISLVEGLVTSITVAATKL